MEQAKSVEDFMNIIKRYQEYSDIFYRGQSEEYKTITSSISRHVGYTQNEFAIFNESIQMKSTEFEGVSEPIEYLSKMQHYGIPTRLIDLSVNPLIALFFAVQDSDSIYSGNVHVYVQQKYSLRDKRVKLLALLATLDSYDIQYIQTSFEKKYGEKINKKEILEFVSQNAIIEHTEELKKSNVRLFNQQGTFVICGNNVEGECIKRSINSLDTPPSMVIRIPYEHKQAVKTELDQKYNINEAMIYPELPSVASYLKEKYKSIELKLDGAYSILNSKEQSTFGAKRVSVAIVLNKALRINEIKHIGIDVIEQYKENYDVVWIYIAKNGDDYIMNNWVIRGQWIKPSLNKRYKPFSLGPVDENNNSWKFEKSYSTLSDFYDEYSFDDDKKLYVLNMKLFKKLVPIYIQMEKYFKGNNLFNLIKYIKRNRSVITKSFIEFGDFGHSRDNKFNKYLENFQNFSMYLENTAIWLTKDNIDKKTKLYKGYVCFKEVKFFFKAIQAEADKWKKNIKLSEKEYKSIDIKDSVKKEYQYTQTLPIKSDALDVWFNLDIFKNEDNTIYIKGTTNLFDNASLIISIKNVQGELLAQGKAEVTDGNYDFGLFSRKGKGYIEGLYEATISLSTPAVQDKKFVEKAGIEYENLKGEYVDRSGLGPTLNYHEKFNI